MRPPSKELVITDECINCGVCKDECPMDCIWEDWDAFDEHLIDTDKCNFCVGYHDSPQCIEVCPMEAVVYTKT